MHKIVWYYKSLWDILSQFMHQPLKLLLRNTVEFFNEIICIIVAQGAVKLPEVNLRLGKWLLTPLTCLNFLYQPFFKRGLGSYFIGLQTLTSGRFAFLLARNLNICIFWKFSIILNGRALSQTRNSNFKVGILPWLKALESFYIALT